MIIRRIRVLGVVTAALLMSAAAMPAIALTPDDNEKAKLKACEKRLCDIVVNKATTGPDLACSLKKTWASKDLKKNKTSKVSWLFGDARCEADITIARATILAVLRDKSYKLKFPAQIVNCQVERSGKLRPVEINIAPKMMFKKGKVQKIWLNLKKVTGPSDIKGLIWTVAKLEDSIGIFHKPMLKQVNKFLGKKCQKIIHGKPKKNKKK